MNYTVQNDPNPGRLIESLRNLGYGNYEAVADIVDNSLDAEATKVAIRVGLSKGEPFIHIADDGAGMNLEILDQAMRLGSLTSRDEQSDLGKFGMGLVTASLSIARHCTVITRQEGTTLASAWDVDEIIAQNRFLKRLEPASRAEVALLRDYIGDAPSGTLVILEKCDQLRNSNTTVFAKTLASHLGRVHRFFLSAGKVFTINGEAVAILDPLELDREDTVVDFDTELPVKVKRGNKETIEIVRIRIALISPKDASDHDLAVSMHNQGFYIMRNQRQIMAAHTLDCFTKHNDFNQMRGEIFFPGTMDDVIGIEFTKRQVDINQSVYDQIAAVLKPNCSRIKRMFANKGKVQMSAQNKELHDQAIRAIGEKDKLLLKPKARVEKRSPNGVKVGTVTPKGTERTREKLNRTREVERRLKCSISEEKMGPNGQIYECDMQGTTLIIRYNIEHPFFQRFILENTNEGRMVTAADFLIYSMATAELRMVDEDKHEIVNTFKSELSSNLRTLLN